MQSCQRFRSFSRARLKLLLLAVVVVIGLSGCLRVRVAQQVAAVKTNYEAGNFPRVLGYASKDEMGQKNARFDPPGNFTVQDVRAMLIKSAGSADYDYHDLFNPDSSGKVSADRQQYLQQLALLEMRALVHQYFATHRPPYDDAHDHPFIKRATFLVANLRKRNFAQPWERAEILACYGDLALLDGQYEAASAAYEQILAMENVPSPVLAQYGKRYIQSHDAAVGYATVSRDQEQAELFEKHFAENMKNLSDAAPDLPVGMYARIRLLAIDRQPLAAFNQALLMWRQTDTEELRTSLDRFVTLQLREYWPLMQTDPAFEKLILDQWAANKVSTSGSSH